MNGGNESHERSIFLIISFVEYQKGFENDSDKGPCCLCLLGIPQGCGPPAPKVSTQRGVPNFLLLTTHFQKNHVSSQKQFISMYRILTVLIIKPHHPGLMSKVSYRNSCRTFVLQCLFLLHLHLKIQGFPLYVQSGVFHLRTQPIKAQSRRPL